MIDARRHGCERRGGEGSCNGGSGTPSHARLESIHTQHHIADTGIEGGRLRRQRPPIIPPYGNTDGFGRLVRMST